jgi:hypothetical protein
MPDDSSNTADDLPEAYQGDRLFRGALDWQHNAVVDYWSLEADSYARGYKNGADYLVEVVLRDPTKRDVLVFPIVFLYRHYLELRMKDTIVYGEDLLGLPERFPAGHRLDELWRRCRTILERVLRHELQGELDKAEQYILEFAMKDVSSEAFRYPTNREGNPALPFGIVNLRHFRDVMAELASRLDEFSEDIFHRRRETRSANRIEYRGHNVHLRSERLERDRWSPVAMVFWDFGENGLQQKILSASNHTFSTREDADEHASVLAMKWINQKIGPKAI